MAGCRLATETVTLEIDGQIGILRIDHPPVNALHPLVSDRILELAEGATPVKGDLRALVLTGSGRCFVAGGDIRYFTELNRQTAEQYALRIQRMQDALHNHVLPVIAAVNGAALGGGCELMMACDIRIADERALIGLPEVGLGLIPAAGGTQNLPRLVPMGVAKRMLFTGERLTAVEARAIGLVDEVVPAGQALSRAMEIARRIASNAPLAVRAAKRAVNRGLEMPAADGYRLEAQLLGELFETGDLQEGVSAFLAKRLPHFKGQ